MKISTQRMLIYQTLHRIGHDMNDKECRK